MAAATTIIAGAAMAAGAAQTIKGISDRKKAKDALKNYKRQELTNTAEGIQISTKGSDLIREEGARNSNNLIGAVSRGGARAITGNVGRIASVNHRYNNAAAAQLDRQIQQRNYAIARENVRIQQMYERREEADLAGIGREMEAAKQTTWNGISTFQNGLNYGAMNGMFGEAVQEGGDLPEIVTPEVPQSTYIHYNPGRYV